MSTPKMCVVRMRFFSLDREPPVPVARVLVDGLLVRFRLVFDVPFQAVVEQALGTRPAGTTRSRKPCPGRGTAACPLRAGQLRRASPFDLPADGVLDDVIDDVGRRVVDAAGLADLGLFLDLGLVAGRQPDHLAQEPLVDGSQDFDGQDAEVIGRTVGEVQALQDRLENLVVDRQLRRDAVGVFVDAVVPSGSGTGRSCTSRRPCGTGRA